MDTKLTGINPHEITVGDTGVNQHLKRKKEAKLFLQNYHPLCSICSPFPVQHSFSRNERFVVFICDIVFAFFLSIFVAESVEDYKESYGFNTNDMFVQIFVSVICGLIKSLANGVLKFIAICPCCLTYSCNNTCRKCWKCIGRCLMVVWAFFLVVLLITSIKMAVQYSEYHFSFVYFLIFFITINIWSWIFSYLILVVCFKCKNRKGVYEREIAHSKTDADSLLINN